MIPPAHRPALFVQLAPALLKIVNVGPIGFRKLMLLIEADIALKNQ